MSALEGVWHRDCTAENVGFYWKYEHFRRRTQKRCVWSFYSRPGRGAPKCFFQIAAIQAPNAPFVRPSSKMFVFV